MINVNGSAAGIRRWNLYIFLIYITCRVTFSSGTRFMFLQNGFYSLLFESKRGTYRENARSKGCSSYKAYDFFLEIIVL
jgi:hypothetical protein